MDDVWITDECMVAGWMMDECLVDDNFFAVHKSLFKWLPLKSKRFQEKATFSLFFNGL